LSQPVCMASQLNWTLYSRMRWFLDIFKLSMSFSASAVGLIGPKWVRRVRTNVGQLHNQSGFSEKSRMAGSNNSRAVPRRWESAKVTLSSLWEKAELCRKLRLQSRMNLLSLSGSELLDLSGYGVLSIIRSLVFHVTLPTYYLFRIVLFSSVVIIYLTLRYEFFCFLLLD
jgi:hypothetical protein